MNLTPNYNFKMPEGNEFVGPKPFNDNFLSADEIIKAQAKMIDGLTSQLSGIANLITNIISTPTKHEFALQSGFASEPGRSYYFKTFNNVVTLIINVYYGSDISGNTNFATLPAGFIPPAPIVAPAVTTGESAGNPLAGRVIISTAGVVTIVPQSAAFRLIFAIAQYIV